MIARPLKARLTTRGLLLRLTGLLAITLPLANDSSAQQYAVDDAEIVELNACQFEAWHGQTESWILPACQFIPDLEVTAGVGFVDEGGDSRGVEYVVEGKYIFRELRPNDLAVGLVAGVGFDPFASSSGERLHEVFAYVPLTLSVFNDRALVHGNIGWVYHEDDEDHHGHSHSEGGHHAVTWGVRTDVWVHPRLALLVELYGEDRFYPEFQLLSRIVIIPDRLEMDLSWAGNTEPGFSGSGWAFGLAWTPPPFR